MEKQKFAKGVTLSAICVKDPAKTRRLFVDLLGLEVKSEAPEYNWMEIGGDEGTLIGVGKVAGECADVGFQPAPGENAWVSVEVTDVVAAKAHLSENGVQFHGDVIEVPGHVKMALFSDDDDNRFWLVEKLD